MNAIETRLALALSDVTMRFRGEPQAALDCLNLTINRGEKVALIGASGSGKSTLLNLVDGRLRGWSGAGTVLGRPLLAGQVSHRQTAPETGFIFQEFALIPRATVRENVLNGRLGRMPVLNSLLGRFSAEDHGAAEKALRDAGILELAEKRVDRLSGGQRQRVAIARCLAQEPKLILADEPVSQLDPVRAKAVMSLLADSAANREATLMFSTHQPENALSFADRVLGLKSGRLEFDLPSSKVRQRDIDAIYADVRAQEHGLRLVV